MKPCEEFELQIEMRLHGALHATRAAALDAHLSHCAACRAFETLSQETEKNMTAQTMADVGAVDWQAMREQIRAKLKGDSRRRFKMSLLVLAVEAPAIWMMTAGHAREVLVKFASAWAILVAVLAFATWVRFRDMRRYEQNRSDLLFFYRWQLERGISALRLIWILLPIALLGLALPSGPHSLLHWVGVGLLALFFLSLVTYIRLVRVPQLQRELEVLKGR
jgi:hypothetical protein